MSAPTTHSSTTTNDVRLPSRLRDTRIDPVPFSRLVRLELRKLLDTRAGRFLILATALLTLVVVVVMICTGSGSSDRGFRNFVEASVAPAQILLPILGIMAVTTEWSQRTGLVTFTLEPRRSRVAFAKWLAASVMGVAVVVLAFVLGAAATGVDGLVRGTDPSWHMSAFTVLGLVFGQLLYVAMGVAFGMLIQNTPGAVVAYLVLPIAWGMVGAISWMSTIAEWADTSRTLSTLLDGSMSGADWAHLVVSLAIWIGIPMSLGIWRMTHSEVKSG
ncbi:ABC transporter permease [Rudaeicoccus suwonensis]|uniref:ABC-type transport system involved in multi-copper enzyme maturation permease subunit n=1 Tax=Rudaeicoccus suwonensis TaxID=657409 RepID=A0A561EBQ1_9MICO|nr:ABC transporter permease [Rudaeicoccus suwonensis]TWE13041.1 ABC-type transport system involved in multi-copper enzyme maturation permease subunit [Rudaeicoccus suwonensis]